MTPKSRFCKSLAQESREDRLCRLHLVLRNIPKKFLEEYLEVNDKDLNNLLKEYLRE